MQSNKKSLKDHRAVVFEVALQWIIHMIAFCNLKACLLENVKGTLMHLNGEAPFFERVLNMLRSKVPEWNWGVDLLCSRDFMLPSSRERALLRGMHKIFSPTALPACLPPFGRAKLADFLAADLPCLPSSRLTAQQQINKRWFDNEVRKALASGKVSPEEIVVYCVDRQAGLTYTATWTIGTCPTLTTHNCYLFLCRAGEVLLPEGQRTLHRFLTPAERFALQGKDPYMAALLPSRVSAVKGAGNSYPTPLIVAGLYPLLNAISTTGGRGTYIHAWPGPF